MMVVCYDIDTIQSMSLSELWSNYEAAMDSALACAEAGDREMSYFYISVVKVTLDTYFEAIEEEVNAD